MHPGGLLLGMAASHTMRLVKEVPPMAGRPCGQRELVLESDASASEQAAELFGRSKKCTPQVKLGDACCRRAGGAGLGMGRLGAGLGTGRGADYGTRPVRLGAVSAHLPALDSARVALALDSARWWEAGALPGGLADGALDGSSPRGMRGLAELRLP